MFDIGLWEFVLCGVIALVVLGPERLPKAARTVGTWAGKARRAWFSLRTELEQEFEIQELRQQIQQTQQQLQQLQQPSLERLESLNEVTDAYKASSSTPTLPPTAADAPEPGSEAEPVGFASDLAQAGATASPAPVCPSPETPAVPATTIPAEPVTLNKPGAAPHVG